MKKVALLDICLPDYFTGYHLPALSVCLPSGTITCEEMADMIDSELNAVWDYINPDDDDTITALYDAYIEELRKEGYAVFYESEDSEDSEECAYAYFSMINPVTVHGITYLNP